jgi:hypothetical protein
VTAEGGPAEPVPSVEPESTTGEACWAPDGESLVFDEWLPSIRSWPPDQVLLRRLDLKTRRVATVPGSKGLWAPKCARDGRIFTYDSSDYAAQQASKRFLCKMLEPDRGVWKSYVLPVEIAYPNWSRDGRFIYTIDVPGEHLYRFDPSTRHLARIADIDGFRLTWDWMGLAPDDSPLVLRDVTQWDIYRLDWEAP